MTVRIQIRVLTAFSFSSTRSPGGGADHYGEFLLDGGENPLMDNFYKVRD